MILTLAVQWSRLVHCSRLARLRGLLSFVDFSHSPPLMSNTQYILYNQWNQRLTAVKGNSDEWNRVRGMLRF